MKRKPPPLIPANAGRRRRRRLLMISATGLGSVALIMSLTPHGGAAEPRTEARTEAEAIAEATRAARADAAVYQSRPDLLQAPELTTAATDRADSGLLLTTPFGSGAALYDNSGALVSLVPGDYSNLQEITWRGEPALAAVENGGAVVLDSSYAEVARFSMAGHTADFHVLAFNEDASRVLMAAYVPTPHDLSEYGGPVDATVMDNIIQEIDTATGEVTFEWSALDHVPPDESHEPLVELQVDYLHTNSVAYANDGDILISARHTSTIYRIDPASGEIVWRFGGKNTDFDFPDETAMPSYQHDATQLPNGHLTAFDNGVGRDPQTSRGSVWEIDEQAMTAELVADLRPARPAFGEIMGSNQPTANGNQVVNFGDSGRIVEFDGDGTVALTASFEQGVFSYKVTRTTDFVGTPTAPPDVAWTEPTLHMSWNGATEVDRWRVEARPEDGGSFRPLTTVERTGFETEAKITTPGDAATLRVHALDENGHILGTRTLPTE